MRLGKRVIGAVSCQLTANPVFPDGCIEVSSLECAKKYRKQGIASMFLDSLVKEADKAGKVLVLFPEQEWQAEWYGKFNFVIIQPDPVLMARKPLTSRDAKAPNDDRNN